MTKQTKLELVQINSRLASENEALRLQVADLQLTATLVDGTDVEVARLTGELAHASALIAHLSTPTHRVVRHMPQWQVDRAAAMAAARAMAMGARIVVKV